jgi:beta-N-acetylhexosaminidase
MAKQKKKSKKPLFIIIIIIILLALILLSLFFFNNILKIINNNSSSILQKTSSISLQQNSSTNTSSKKVDEIQKMMDSMSIDEKLGQMVIGGYDNINEIKPIISENKLGGVILYKNNITSVSQTINDIDSLKQSNLQNKVPIFISVDQEGGSVNRFPASMDTFESALSIGDKNDPVYAFNSGVKIANAMKQLGFNLDFAPVLDIFSNPKNTVIADRAFGRTPDRVSEIGIQVMKGLQSENIIATAKHFPGHGDTVVDSHVGLPIVNKTIEELNSFEFKPFIEAINNNVDMIMIAHIELSTVDDLPASLSNKVVTGILRNQLGFKGVVITDDITMGAITQKYTLSKAAVMAVDAGCDIVLVAKGAQNSVLVLNSLKSAYENGELTEQRIDESVYRILSLKKKYGLSDLT